MNKKADVPITILVLGTIAVCVIALISFNLAEKEKNDALGYFRDVRVLYKIRDYLYFCHKPFDECLKEMRANKGFIIFALDVFVEPYQDNGNIVLRLVRDTRTRIPILRLPIGKRQEVTAFEVKVPINKIQ